MRHMVSTKILFTTLALVLLLLSVSSPLLAWGASDQPVEWDTSSTNGYSLSAQGLVFGCKKGRWWNADFKFTLRTPPSGPYDPEWYRITSSNSKIRNIFNSKPPGERSVMGYNLHPTGTAYFCVGLSDVNAVGGQGIVERDLKVWFKR